MTKFPVLRDALSFGGVLVHSGTYREQGSGVSVLTEHDKCRVHIIPRVWGTWCVPLYPEETRNARDLPLSCTRVKSSQWHGR